MHRLVVTALRIEGHKDLEKIMQEADKSSAYALLIQNPDECKCQIMSCRERLTMSNNVHQGVHAPSASNT